MKFTTEWLADWVPLAGDADALEGLEAFLVALAHADIHAQRVARAEGRDLTGPFLLGFDERMHRTTHLIREP